MSPAMRGELDVAADWYERMIEESDPFALLYAADDYTTSLRAHHRWRRWSELMKLPQGSGDVLTEGWDRSA